MSRRQLQRDIRDNGGFILSDGTLNMQHLLPKAYDVLVAYNVRGTTKLKHDILMCFGVDKLPSGEAMWNAQYYEHISLLDMPEAHQLANDVWNEDIYELFNQIAPAGYYFGSVDGDGACIGWFKCEEVE